MRIEAPLRTETHEELPAAAAPLSPSVSHEALVHAQDAMTCLYAAMLNAGNMRANTSMMNVDMAQTERENATARAQEAAQKAKDEADDGGIFDAITKNMGVASVVGLCTFRYDMVVSDILSRQASDVADVKYDAVDLAAMANGPAALAVSLLRKSEMMPEDLRGNIGPALITDADVEKYKKDAIVANLAVVGAACSVLTAGSTTAFWVAAVGASIALSGQLVARTGMLDGALGNGWSDKIGTGMQIGGALFAGGASFATSGATTAANASVSGAAKAVGGGTAALKAADGITTAVQKKESDDAQEALLRTNFDVATKQAVVDAMVRGAIDAKKAITRTMEIVHGVIETMDATNQTAAR